MLSTVDTIVTEIQTELNNQLEAWTRIGAIPPIKGEITKGKLKWRGIKIISQKMWSGDFYLTYWVEQKGKRISPFIHA